MKKAVIFDWGGVLIDNPEPGFLSYWSNHFKLPAEKIAEVRKRFAPDFQRGTIPEAEFWKNFCQELNVPIPKVPSLFGDAFKFAYSPKQEMFQLASALHGKYKIGLLSNAELPAMQYFLAQNYPMFDSAVFSCAEHLIKPEPRIYQLAIQRLGVQPKEAVFIDDVQRYVDGARAVGLDAILFQNPGQVKLGLTNHNIQLN